MKRFLFTLTIILTPIIVFAQATNTVRWEYIGATPTVVATYTQTLEVDNSNVTIPSGSCIEKLTTDTSCSVVIPALAAGNHILRVAATLNGLTSESILTGVNPANFPKVPGNLNIKITITITVP